MTTAGTLEIDVVLNGKKVRLGLNDLKKRFGFLNKEAFHTNKIFGRLARFASVGYLAKLSLDTAKLTRELGFMSQKMNMSFESLSRTRNAFKSFGGDAKVIDKTLSHIVNGIAKLQTGDDGSYVSALASMKIPYKDREGKIRDPDLILGDIADFIQREKAAGQEDVVIQQRVRQVVPDLDDYLYDFLSKGKEEFFKSIGQATFITDTEKNKLEGLSKSWSGFKANLEGLYDKMSATLAPFGKMVVDFGTFLTKIGQEYPATTTAATALLALFKGKAALSTLGALGKWALAKFGLGAASSAVTGATSTAGGITLSGMLASLAAFFGPLLYSTKAGPVDEVKMMNLVQSDDQKDKMRGIYMMLSQYPKEKITNEEFNRLSDMFGLAPANRRKISDAISVIGKDFGIHHKGEDYFFEELPKYLDGLGNANQQIIVDVNVDNNITQQGEKAFLIESVIDTQTGKERVVKEVYGTVTGS